MRPILSTISLHHHPWPVVLDIARASRFTAIDLMMITPSLHLDPEALSPPLLRQAFSERGLTLEGIHGGGIDGTSDASLRSSLKYIMRVMRCAGACAARFVNINGMPVPPAASASVRDAMLERIIAGLSELAEPARALGLTICLENHASFQIETLDDYQRIFETFPLPGHDWLAATLDTGHFVASGVSPAAAAHALGTRVRHVHIKDHRHGSSVPLGSGEIDNLACVRALRAIGYDDCLSAEVELADAASERAALETSMSYLCNLITLTQDLP